MTLKFRRLGSIQRSPFWDADSSTTNHAISIVLCKSLTFITVVHTASHLPRADADDSSTIHIEKSNKMQQYQNFIIPYLYEAQHVSGDTPPIIRSLKLH